MDVMVKRSVAVSAREKRSTRKKKGIIKDDKSCMNEARKIREGRKTLTRRGDRDLGSNPRLGTAYGTHHHTDRYARPARPAWQIMRFSEKVY